MNKNNLVMFFYTEINGTTCLFIQTEDMQHSIEAKLIENIAPIPTYTIEYDALKEMIENIKIDLDKTINKDNKCSLLLPNGIEPVKFYLRTENMS